MKSWPGWEAVAWPRPDCTQWRANDPSSVVPSLEWSSCPHPGCRTLKTGWGWGPGGLEPFFARSVVVHRRPSGKRVLFFSMYDGSFPPGGKIGHGAAVVFDLESGTPLSGWAGCADGGAFRGDQMVLMDYSVDTPAMFNFYWGDIEAVPATPRFSLILQIYNNLRWGGEVFAWDGGGVSVADNKFFTLAHDGGWTSEVNAFVGTDLFFYSESQPWNRLMVRHADGTIEALIVNPDGQIGGWASDGKQTVWLKSADRIDDPFLQWGLVEVYTAPHVVTSSAFQPKRLGRATFLEHKAIGGPMFTDRGYATYGGERPLRVYRLSDGFYKTLPDPPIAGTTWQGPVWVDDKEVIAVAVKGITAVTVVRYDLDSLGPWTPLDP